MAQFPHLPLFTDAFMADTGHLNATETGAYLMLLMVAWRSPGCKLPDDDQKLSRWARVDRRSWGRIKLRVMEFWTLADGFWTQKRLALEADRVSKSAQRSRENGKLGGRPNSLKPNGHDILEGSPQDTQMNVSYTYKEEEREPPLSLTSFEKEAAEAAPPAEILDPRKDLFGRGVKEIVRRTGRAEGGVRGIVGKWLKHADDNAVIVLRAVDAALENDAADPVPWIERRLSFKRNGAGPSPHKPQPRCLSV